MKKTDILEVTSRKLAPFVLMFGFYVVTYGHLSPGGGFQGGVVLASAVVLLFLCHGSEVIEKVFPMRSFVILESCGLIAFILMGITGMIFRGDFLAIFLPVLRGREEPVAGFILVLNIIIGFKVGAGISMICYYLFRKE